MASRNSPSAARSAPRAEAAPASPTSPHTAARGCLARFALQLEALIDGRDGPDNGGASALARAAAIPAAQSLGRMWAKLDDQAHHGRRGQHDLPAVRVLLPAASLPPVA